MPGPLEEPPIQPLLFHSWSAKITAWLLCNRRVWNLSGQAHKDVGAGSMHIWVYISTWCILAFQLVTWAVMHNLLREFGYTRCRCTRCLSMQNQFDTRGSGFNYVCDGICANRWPWTTRRLSHVITGPLNTLWFPNFRLHPHIAALRHAVQRHLAFGLCAQGKMDLLQWEQTRPLGVPIPSARAN